jgi:RNA polymerase sigma-70 factor (ECF subfamily)
MADEAHLRALLLKGLAGEEAAHRAFLAEAAALLRGFFRNRLRGRAEDAEDLVQETLVALHTRRDSYDPNYPLTAWMFAIARYRLIDFLRRAKHRAHASLDDGMDVGEIDPDYAASDAKRDLNTLLAQLPAKQQVAIRLVKLEEKSVKEAADETGFSESDIKISIHRGMKTLMRLIGEASPT